jgi:ribose 5-phosphate isomerase B
MLKVAIAADHAGFQLKEHIKEKLASAGYEITDYGTYSNESCDYPDYVHPLAESIENGSFPLGLIFCGSGNGVNMVANKHQAIRSALCWLPEIAELARAHNNANVCAVPARFLETKVAEEIVHTFLNTEFEGGRHQRRIDKICL